MNTSQSQEVNDRIGCITLLCGVNKSHTSWDTNRKFWNFLEYQLRGSQNRCFALPNFSYRKTELNSNIMPNSCGELQSEVQLLW